ncbi:hypothetical protein O3P69_003754 [Scylla paramamosain]|uniref:Uncharacterized protein n=1 Tax=Scylla paramamosain TaxID=85552 RepID=A0AAW0UFR2_SCYPA
MIVMLTGKCRTGGQAAEPSHASSGRGGKGCAYIEKDGVHVLYYKHILPLFLTNAELLFPAAREQTLSMKSLAKKLSSCVLPGDQLLPLLEAHMTKKHKKCDLPWVEMVKRLLTKAVDEDNGMLFENAATFINIQLSETVRKGLKNPSQFGQKYSDILNSLLTHLHLILEDTNLQVVEIHTLSSQILAAVIDMSIAAYKKGEEASLVAKIFMKLTMILGYSQEHLLDALLHCKTLIHSRLRQPSIQVPLIKRLFSSIRSGQTMAPVLYLKYLLLGKLWLFMTEKKELGKTRTYIAKVLKLPENIPDWAERERVSWLGLSQWSTRLILKSMTLRGAHQTFYGDKYEEIRAAEYLRVHSVNTDAHGNSSEDSSDYDRGDGDEDNDFEHGKAKLELENSTECRKEEDNLIKENSTKDQAIHKVDTEPNDESNSSSKYADESDKGTLVEAKSNTADTSENDTSKEHQDDSFVVESDADVSCEEIQLESENTEDKVTIDVVTGNENRDGEVVLENGPDEVKDDCDSILSTNKRSNVFTKDDDEIASNASEQLLKESCNNTEEYENVIDEESNLVDDIIITKCIVLNPESKVIKIDNSTEEETVTLITSDQDEDGKDTTLEAADHCGHHDEDKDDDSKISNSFHDITVLESGCETKVIMGSISETSDVSQYSVRDDESVILKAPESDQAITSCKESNEVSTIEDTKGFIVLKEEPVVTEVEDSLEEVKQEGEIKTSPIKMSPIKMSPIKTSPLKASPIDVKDTSMMAEVSPIKTSPTDTKDASKTPLVHRRRSSEQSKDAVQDPVSRMMNNLYKSNTVKIDNSEKEGSNNEVQNSELLNGHENAISDDDDKSVIVDEDEEIESMLQNIVKDTGRPSSIHGLRERLLSESSVKNEQENSGHDVQDDKESIKNSEMSLCASQVKTSDSASYPLLESTEAMSSKSVTHIEDQKDTDSLLDTIVKDESRLAEIRGLREPLFLKAFVLNENGSLSLALKLSNTEEIESVMDESRDKCIEGADEAYEASSDASEDPAPRTRRRSRSLRKSFAQQELQMASDSDSSPVRAFHRRGEEKTLVASNESNQDVLPAESDKTPIVKNTEDTPHVSMETVVTETTETDAMESSSKALPPSSQNKEPLHGLTLAKRSISSSSDTTLKELPNKPSSPFKPNSDDNLENGIDHEETGQVDRSQKHIDEELNQGMAEGIYEGEEVEVLSTSGIEEEDEKETVGTTPEGIDNRDVEDRKTDLLISKKSLRSHIRQLCLTKDGKDVSSDSGSKDGRLAQIPVGKAQCLSQVALTKEVLISPDVSDEECELVSPGVDLSDAKVPIEVDALDDSTSQKNVSLCFSNLNLQKSSGVSIPDTEKPDNRRICTRRSSRGVAGECASGSLQIEVPKRSSRLRNQSSDASFLTKDSRKADSSSAHSESEQEIKGEDKNTPGSPKNLRRSMRSSTTPRKALSEARLLTE